MRLPDRLGRRGKALFVALCMAGGLLIASPAMASEEDPWILAMLCAPYSPGHIVWELLGCDKLRIGPPNT